MGTKKLFTLVFKARHLTFCDFHRLRVPDQTFGGIPLYFEIFVEDEPSELS